MKKKPAKRRTVAKSDSEKGGTPHPGALKSTAGTTLARHIAASFDFVFAAVLTVVIVKQLPDSLPAIQLVVATIGYLGYFFFFEALINRTPGKVLTGLTVTDYQGNRCSLRQTAIRTLYRLLEVNPLLLGGLPAAARILWSGNKQRFGDKAAGTIVIFRAK